MTTPYWLQPSSGSTSNLSGTVEADVVVIGGGLCGTSAAYHLAQAGIAVALVEARTISESASGRNAGFLLQGTAERYNRAVELMGRDRARRIHQWSIENHTRMAETINAEGIECAYQKRGSLQLAGSPQEEQELIESAELLTEDGFEATLLDAAALPEALQQAGFTMGVHLPADGELHPARFVQGVGHAAQRHGAQIFEGSRVMALDAGSTGEVRVETEGGEIQAMEAHEALSPMVMPVMSAVECPKFRPDRVRVVAYALPGTADRRVSGSRGPKPKWEGLMPTVYH